MITEQEKRYRKQKEDFILFIIGYILMLFFLSHFLNALKQYPNFEISMLDQALNGMIQSIETSKIIFPKKEDMDVISFCSIMYIVMALYYFTTRKKYMPGKEHGTASWGTKTDSKKIVNKNDEENVILTNSEKMSLDSKKIRKNLNTLVIGGSGTGKTRFFVKPNILQANTSYVITDPKGEILRDTGYFLKQQGFKVKVFNLIEMLKSLSYNPFAYIKQEVDVLKIINMLIKNTTPKGAGTGDPFWEKSEVALLQALFFYTINYLNEEEHNFATILHLLRLAEVKEEDEGFKSELDFLFEEIEEEDPDNIACKQYAIFKQSAGKTAKSILISVGVRLSVFNISSLSKITEKDELELNTIGDEKTALFIIISDSDTTFNFLVAMMYSQLFDQLYYTADFLNNGSLKFHVRCILDEFANIGEIPNFEKLLSTMRSRNISAVPILQNLSQIKGMYKEDWEGIIGNCDSILFLGGKEPGTVKYISDSLGKETIDTKTVNYSKGRNSSTSYNYGILGRELMTPTEIQEMPDNNCILMIRGMKPFYSEKFKLEKHKNYKYLYDANNENVFELNDSNTKKTNVEKKAFEKSDNKEQLLEKEYTIKDLNEEIFKNNIDISNCRIMNDER